MVSRCTGTIAQLPGAASLLPDIDLDHGASLGIEKVDDALVALHADSLE
jgi:hypothetical protein